MSTKRNGKPRNVRDMLHMFFEGLTEFLYFMEIKGSRSNVFPNPNYFLDLILRDKSQESQADPEQVLNLLRDYKSWIESNNRDYCPVGLFLTKYLNAVSKINQTLKKDIYHYVK